MKQVYLGRFIANGQRTVANDYDLKKRKYLGPTSTCAELSFLMSNQILSQRGKIVWDCFAGTGSLLIAATVHGATCVGTDIDVRVLKGIKKGKKAESVRSNFEQYKLAFPELIRADLSRLPLLVENRYACLLLDEEEWMGFYVILRMEFVLELVRHVPRWVRILLLR